MNLTEEQIVSNYNELIKYIDIFEEDRSIKLKKLYDDLNEKIMLAPSSGKHCFHSAFPGGHVVHTLNVIKNAEKLTELWKQQGATIDYTYSELIMAAMNHDLGKAGDLDYEYYVPNDNEWKKNTLGEIYKINGQLHNMEHSDRSLWLLQVYDIKLTQKEWISIKTHDGVFKDGNKFYFITYDEDKQFKTCLPILLQQADHMSATIEHQQYKNSNHNIEEKNSYNKTRSEKINKTAKKVEENLASKESIQNIFDDLFK